MVSDLFRYGSERGLSRRIRGAERATLISPAVFD